MSLYSKDQFFSLVLTRKIYDRLNCGINTRNIAGIKSVTIKIFLRLKSFLRNSTRKNQKNRIIFHGNSSINNKEIISELSLKLDFNILFYFYYTLDIIIIIIIKIKVVNDFNETYSNFIISHPRN